MPDRPSIWTNFNTNWPPSGGRGFVGHHQLDDFPYEFDTEGLLWEANERNEDVRLLWELDVAQYTNPEMLVVLDESAVDSHMLQ